MQMQMANMNNPQQNGPSQTYLEHNQTLGDLDPNIGRGNYQGSYQPGQQQINQGVSQGFGQFFFDASDPNIAKTNVPIKKQSSMHIAIIISTLILFGGIAGAIVVFMISPLMIIYSVVIIVLTYIVYLIVSIVCSNIRGYITNLKKFDDYKQTYDKMVKGRGYFKFWIECYHYRTSGSNSSRKKVVTHTATFNFYPSLSIDQSGNVDGIKDIKNYVFVNYLKKFYFGDQRSDSILKNAYESFLENNRRDNHQDHTNTLQIQGYEAQVGFCTQGQSPHNSIVFYIISILGLALPYACILQRSVSRYEINILKKLTY